MPVAEHRLNAPAGPGVGFLKGIYLGSPQKTENKAR
jgi:hypothetical protein